MNKSIKIALTQWEAEQLKSALDYLINGYDDDVLVSVSNQINEQLKRVNRITIEDTILEGANACLQN